jgi:NAD(P)-dependent dehydrogenase (short-subunit alcohol dehydrogenase family)
MKSSEKVAIVTGGSRNVGATIAEALLEDGFIVHICSRTLEELEKAKQELKGVRIRQLDIRDGDGILAWVEEIIKESGRIDVLVNNAALTTPLGPFVQNDLDEWIQTLDVNLLGTLRFTKAVLPFMIRQGGGAIINLGGGGSAYPRADHSAYACSKAAIVRFTDTLAEEVSVHNIRVNVLSPGKQYSKMRELDRDFGIPFPDEWDNREKVKALTRFLVTTTITGKFIHINDKYQTFTDEIMKSDLYTLRRINP